MVGRERQPCPLIRLERSGILQWIICIADNRRAAGTIQEDYHDWAAIKGIQLEGSVELLSGQEKERAISIYAQKYPLIQADSGPIQAALEVMNWYRLTPKRLYLVDNSKGFGHRDEVELIGP